MKDELESHASTQMWTSCKAGHFSLLVWHGDHWWMKTVTLMIMHIAGADVPNHWKKLRILRSISHSA